MARKRKELDNQIDKLQIDKLQKEQKSEPTEKKKRGRIIGVVVLGILLVAIIGVLGTALVHTNYQLRTLSAQMSYMQDLISVINSNVGSLEANIEAQLEEETSLIEQYEITVSDIDFAESTYTVAIEVIPKEYTDTTQLSLFFGTTEIPLEKDGFHFFGEATLPIEESYASNVTVLFSDDKRRETEVINRYPGIDILGGQYVSAEYSNATYEILVEESDEDGTKDKDSGDKDSSNKDAEDKDGTDKDASNGDAEETTFLHMTGAVNAALNGCGLFEYQSASFEITANGIVQYDMNLLQADFDYQSVATFNAPFMYDATFSVEEGDVICMQIRAMTTDGYEMVYQINHGTIFAEDLDEEVALSYEPDTEIEEYFYFYDRNGHVYKKETSSV